MGSESTSQTTEDFFFLKNTMILGKNLGKGRRIGSEDLFFREHDFGEKIGKGEMNWK